MAACSSRGNQWLITLLGHTELMTGHYSVLRIIWLYSTVKVAHGFRSGTWRVFLCVRRTGYYIKDFICWFYLTNLFLQSSFNRLGEGDTPYSTFWKYNKSTKMTTFEHSGRISPYYPRPRVPMMVGMKRAVFNIQCHVFIFYWNTNVTVSYIFLWMCLLRHSGFGSLPVCVEYKPR